MKFSKKMCTSDHDDGDNVGGGDSVTDDCIAPLSRKVYGLKVLNLDFSELQSSKYTLGLHFDTFKAPRMLFSACKGVILTHNFT